jgi:hypothetical protein
MNVKSLIGISSLLFITFSCKKENNNNLNSNNNSNTNTADTINDKTYYLSNYVRDVDGKVDIFRQRVSGDTFEVEAKYASSVSK